jgi:hypothetical protein
MGFGGFGMGFLDTDPRKKQGQTGGSSKAAQGKDKSVINTGNPADGGVGYGSADHGSGLFAKPYVAPPPDPHLMERTAGELVAEREEAGVAKSHANMGSLAVDFRKSEKKLADAGEQTVQGARDAKVLDARAAAEHQRLVTDPANREAAKFRAQAESSKKYMGQFKAYGERQMRNARNAGSSMGQRSNSGLGLNRSKMSSSGSRASATGMMEYRTGNTIGPDHSGLMQQMQDDFAEVRASGDPSALAALREHSQAPSTMPISTQDAANKQSATGRATPAEMAQAVASANSRNLRPNR